MQTSLDCFPCILRQAIEASRMAGATPSQQKIIVKKTLNLLQETTEESISPAIGAQVHQFVREITGENDPYALVKEKATSEALSLLPTLRNKVNTSQDKLEMALRLSIAGNIIDFGYTSDYDLLKVIDQALEQDFAINDLPLLHELLKKAKFVLILGDNAGEIVFDRLLIEALPLPVTYVVRGGPVLNDATIDDAIAAGIDQVATLVDSGARIPGTILSECSADFQSLFQSADLILSKGMGNYETLSTMPGPIFFLLIVKCPVVSADIGAPVGSIVIKSSSANI